MCEQLNRSLAQAESSYLEFVDACNAAIKSCDEATQICGRKANEARGTKLTTCIAGGRAYAIAITMVVITLYRSILFQVYW